MRNLDSGLLWRVAPRGVEQVAASPDGRWLALATESGVAAAPLTTQTPLRRLRPQIIAQDVAAARQGLVAAVGIEPFGGNAGARVQRWNAAGRPLPALVPPGPLKLSVARSVAISADGRFAAAGYWNGGVVLWPPSASLTPPGVVLGTHRRRVTALAFDSEASLLASGDRGGTLELWRVGTRGPPTRLEAHAGEVLSLAFSPDGRMLASGSDDGAVRLWDPQEGRPLGDPLRLSGPVSAVAFSPDGRSLVAVHGTLTVWDAGLWHPGKDVLERVRRRFCAVISSEAASSSRKPCRRRA